MAGISLRVTPEILISRASDVTTAVDAMDKTMKEIGSIVKGTSSYWKSDAGNKCRADYEKNQEGIDVIINRLKGQPKTLLTMANLYRTTEQEAKAVSQSLPIDPVD